jgi:hypothetical protein
VLVRATVSWDERHSHVAEPADRDGRRRLAVRRGDRHLVDVVEEGVEARPAEHADVGLRCGHALFASDELLVELESFFVSEELLELESDDFVSDDFVSDDFDSEELSDVFVAVLFERLSVL